MSGALPLALAALIPVMIGPLPSQGASLTMHLCNGGTITIPIGKDGPGQDRGCHPKGCHAGTCREQDKEKHPKPRI